MRGQLAECLERLHSCGADAALVSLTRDASNLIPESATTRRRSCDRVTGYVETVRNRLRQTELQLAAEDARVKELHKRRRISYILTATLLIFAATGLVVGGKYLETSRLFAPAPLPMGLIDTLLNTDLRQLPNALSSLVPVRSQITTELQRRWQAAQVGSPHKLRLVHGAVDYRRER